MKKMFFVAFVLLCGVSFGFGHGLVDFETEEMIEDCEKACSQQEQQKFECEVGPGLKPCESQKKGFMNNCMKECTSLWGGERGRGRER